MPLYDELGGINGVVGYFSDITLFTNLGILKESNEYLKTLYHNLKSKRRYYMLLDKRIIMLTSKQAECLLLLAMGKSMKQIASLLNCSHSNIVCHINYLKTKLKVYSTSAIIECFWRNPINWF